METSQEKLNKACKDASGDGVGWIGVIEKDGSVTLRRDEEYAQSHESHYATLDTALAHLAEVTT